LLALPRGGCLFSLSFELKLHRLQQKNANKARLAPHFIRGHTGPLEYVME